MQKNKITCQTCLDLDLESSCIMRCAYIVVIQTADSQTGRQTDTDIDTDRNIWRFD